MTTSTPPARAGEPAGFCPHCDYPTDPGRCPECGRYVDKRELITPRRRLWRRRRRKVAWVMVFLILATFGAGLAYYRMDWIQMIPTPVLLALKGEQRSPVTDELLRRFGAGELTQTQTHRLLAGSVATECDLRVRSPCPTGFELPIKALIKHERASFLVRGHTRTWISLTNCCFTFDDSKQAEKGRWESDRNSQIRAKTPVLTTGTHVLSFTGDVFLHVASSAAVYYIGPVEAAASLWVENRPVTDFIRGKWSPELARDLSNRLRLTLCRTGPGNQGYVEIKTDHLPIAVCGELWYLAAELPFVEHKCDLVSMGAERNQPFRCAHFAFSAAAERYTLQPRPDPGQAFCDDHADYFSGTIEWADVGLYNPMDAATMLNDNALPTRMIPPESDPPL